MRVGLNYSAPLSAGTDGIPAVGGTGVVLFPVGGLMAGKMRTFSVTVNVVSSTGSPISDLARIIEGFSTMKGLPEGFPNYKTGRKLPYNPCSGLACQSPGDTDAPNDPTRAASTPVVGGSIINLAWNLPSPSFSDATPAPADLSLGGGAVNPETLADGPILLPTASGAVATTSGDPCTLIGYKLFIGDTASLVDATDSNVWKMISPSVNLSTNAPLPPEGASYALVAVYRCPDGTIRTSQPSGSLHVSGASLPSVSTVTLSGKVLTISGSNFGNAPRVLINDVDKSDFIISASGSEIVLKGKPKKMNLRAGSNQIKIVNAGQTSQVFILNL